MWGLLALIIYYGNIRVIQMFSDAMKGTTAWYQGQMGEFKTYYYQTFSYKTPLDRDVRNLYIGFFLNNPYGLAGLAQNDLQDILNLALELDAKNVALSPLDHFAWLKHAQLLNLVGRIFNNQDLVVQALAAVQKAQERGGEHLIPYLLRSNIYEAEKKPQLAVDSIKEALKIYPDYYQALCPLVILETKYKLAIPRAELWQQLDKCVDKGDLNSLVQAGYLGEAIKHYQDAKDQVRLEKLKTFVPAR
jgi:tetratricopeptide (TPR) repeat protein